MTNDDSEGRESGNAELLLLLTDRLEHIAPSLYERTVTAIRSLESANARLTAELAAAADKALDGAVKYAELTDRFIALKAELAEAREDAKDARRYRALVASGAYRPGNYGASCPLALRMGGPPSPKVELDEAVDAVIAGFVDAAIDAARGGE